MKQSELPATACNLFNAREKSRVQGAIGCGFAWLKTGARFLNSSISVAINRVISFESHLETALKRQIHSIQVVNWAGRKAVGTVPFVSNLLLIKSNNNKYN